VAAAGATTHATAEDTELAGIDAYWRAANYLSVGQIYLTLILQPTLRDVTFGVRCGA